MNKKSSQSQSQNQAQNQSQTTSTTKTTVKDTSQKATKKSQSFDELQTSKGQYRPVAQAVGNWLDNINIDALNHLNEQAENIFYRKGVTFTVY